MGAVFYSTLPHKECHRPNERAYKSMFALPQLEQRKDKPTPFFDRRTVILKERICWEKCLISLLKVVSWHA